MATWGVVGITRTNTDFPTKGRRAGRLRLILYHLFSVLYMVTNFYYLKINFAPNIILVDSS